MVAWMDLQAREPQPVGAVCWGGREGSSDPASLWLLLWFPLHGLGPLRGSFCSLGGEPSSVRGKSSVFTLDVETTAQLPLGLREVSYLLQDCLPSKHRWEFDHPDLQVSLVQGREVVE